MYVYVYLVLLSVCTICPPQLRGNIQLMLQDYNDMCAERDEVGMSDFCVVGCSCLVVDAYMYLVRL